MSDDEELKEDLIDLHKLSSWNAIRKQNFIGILVCSTGCIPKTWWKSTLFSHSICISIDVNWFLWILCESVHFCQNLRISWIYKQTSGEWSARRFHILPKLWMRSRSQEVIEFYIYICDSFLWLYNLIAHFIVLFVPS